MLNEIKIYCLASQPSIDVCTWRIASWLLDGRLKSTWPRNFCSWRLWICASSPNC